MANSDKPWKRPEREAVEPLAGATAEAAAEGGTEAAAAVAAGQ